VERLEDRRLLSAAGHLAGLKLHRAGRLDIVQGQPTSLIVATVIGTDTSPNPSGDLSGGMHAEVKWGSGKSAVREQAMIESTANPDVSDILASNPLPSGVHTLHVTLTNNGKRVGELSETIRVEKRTPNGVDLHAVAGAPVTAVLGHLENALPAGQQLIVDWGDQTSIGVNPQLSNTTAGLYTVSSTHTYDKPGTYVVKVERESGEFESTQLFFPYDIISTITVSRKK